MGFLEHSIDLGSTGDTRTLVRRGAHRRTAARALGPVVNAARGATSPRRRAQLWFTAVELHELAGHGDPAADRADRHAMFDALCELARVSAYDATSRAVRDRAVELAGDDPELLIRAVTCLRAPVIWSDLDRRMEHGRLRDALETALTQPQPAAIRTRLLVASVLESGVDDAVGPRYRRACEALDLAYGAGDPESVCAALNAVAFTITGPAVLTGWRPIATELLRAAEAADSPDYRALAHYYCFRAACRETDVRAARFHAALALESARGAASRTQLDALVAFEAVVDILRGDPAAAERDYREFAARMTESGVSRGISTALIGDCAVAWARGDLTGLRERLAAAYDVEPDLVAQFYVVVLLRSGDHALARTLFDKHVEVPHHYYWSLMSAFRAHAAVYLGEVDEARALYDALLPCTGTLIGLETGVAVFGPADELLADLADLIGDETSARVLLARADMVRERVRAGLAPGSGEPHPSSLGFGPQRLDAVTQIVEQHVGGVEFARVDGFAEADGDRT